MEDFGLCGFKMWPNGGKKKHGNRNMKKKTETREKEIKGNENGEMK